MRAARRVVGLVVLCLVLGACSTLFGGGSVSQEDLEKVVSDRLVPTLGGRPDRVQCPERLEGEIGATARCGLTMDGDRYRVSLQVTSVEDSTVSFDINLSEESAAG
jgi:hypothetical protein